jgi:hypothetical protein
MTTTLLTERPSTLNRFCPTKALFPKTYGPAHNVLHDLTDFILVEFPSTPEMKEVIGDWKVPAC